MPKIERRKKEPKLKYPRLGTIPKISISSRNTWIFIGMFIVAYGLFYFMLRDKLPFTPDFGSSDAFHSNVSFKYYLWQSIRTGVLPFWTDRLAGGYPLIAETQIGAFFLPHYLIFPFFSSFSSAYVLLFSFHLFLLSTGMFLLLKHLKVPLLLAFLFAITFSWSGVVTFRWVHFNFLQVFSLSPWLFLAYFRWNDSHKKRYVFVLSCIISQMVFAGHMQTVFSLLLGLTLTHIALNYPINYKKSFQFIGIIVLGFLLAAPQILPTILFARYSERSFMNTYQFVVSFLFNTKDLVGFYSSTALGTPQLGTYGALQPTWSRIYWENTPYLGELFIGMLVFASVYYFISYKKPSYFIRIFLGLSFLFLILAFGGDSPIYFIFGLFPFNMFRTPSRYLLEVVFFLMLYASLLFSEIVKRRRVGYILLCSLLVFNCFFLVRTAFAYHVFVDSRTLFQSVNIFSKISPDSHYVVFGGAEKWYETFKKKGWKTQNDLESYLFINAALLPNSNLLTRASSIDIYTGGLKMRRNEYLNSVIDTSLIQLAQKKLNSQGQTKLENLLQLYNIRNIISLQPLNLPHFTVVQIEKKGSTIISLLENKKSKSNLFYVPQNVTSISYLEDIEEEIAQETISETYSFAESLPSPVKQSDENINIQILQIDDQYLKGTIDMKEKKFVAVKKGWYPEWRLFIDGKERALYKTNLVHMGFFVEKGKHTVELRYIPVSFYIGITIALFAIGGVATGIFLLKKN